MSYPFIQNENKIVIYKEGESIYWSNEDEFFVELNEAVLNSDWEEVDKILDTRKTEEAIIEFANGKITYNDGIIFYLGTPIHNVLTNKIVSMIEEDYKNIDPMIKFLENLMKNPSKRSVDELYGFLEYASLPITEDGHFIAYKKVREDFKDIYTGTIDNSVGEKPEMPRFSVDDNKDNTCSEGLHFCSKEYLGHFGTQSSNRVVILKINPRDVVSIPTDYNNTKGRCCLYEVIDTYEDDTLLESKSVYIEDGGCPECGYENYYGSYCDNCGYEDEPKCDEDPCPECGASCGEWDGEYCENCGYEPEDDCEEHCPECGSCDFDGIYCKDCSYSTEDENEEYSSDGNEQEDEITKDEVKTQNGGVVIESEFLNEDGEVESVTFTIGEDD